MASPCRDNGAYSNCNTKPSFETASARRLGESAAPDARYAESTRHTGSARCSLLPPIRSRTLLLFLNTFLKKHAEFAPEHLATRPRQNAHLFRFREGKKTPISRSSPSWTLHP